MKWRSLIGVIAVAGVLQASARVNAPAPGFSLRDQSGAARTLANYKGAVVLVNFWASWCAPCRAELPELNRLAREFSGQPVHVLAINVDAERQAGQGLLSRLRLQKRAALEVLWDRHSRVVRAYDIQTMPSSFIVDQKGVVRFAHSGFRPSDPALWREEIRSLLRKGRS